MEPGGRRVFRGREEEAGGLVAGALTGRMIGIAIKVHKTLGPGLFESFYEDCLALEFANAELRFERQVALPGTYEGVQFTRGYEPVRIFV